MTDKERYVNVAELKIKVRHWAKTRGMSNIALQNFTDMIKSLPVTVKGDLETTLEEKAELVKHGKWVEESRKADGIFDLYQTFIICSICGNEHYYGTGDKPNFCDKCGAQMEPYGGDKHD